MNLGGVSWRLIYDTENKSDKTYFNKAYKDAGSGILVRECEGQDCAVPMIFYKRITDVATWEPYDDMFSTWSSNNNLINNDFELYSSLKDLVMGQNKWTFCNYDDFNGKIGFPRDCGPNGPVIYHWYSEKLNRGVKDFEWSVL